jgi:uncharacterized protein
MNQGTHPIVERIANGVNLPVTKVNSVLNLSSEGGTVAFIARYRKEQTGGLDEVAVRDILNERDRVLDILDRQQTIIKAIDEQKKLSPELRTKILTTFNKLELEDIYAPYKKKKKTKADIARELGIGPFAETIIKQRIEEGDCVNLARGYLDPLKKLTDPQVIIEHAINIIVEQIAHDVDIKKKLRASTFETGFVYSKKAPRFKEDNSKFETYFEYKEKIKNLTNPKNSHRVLAIQRGFNEKVLTIGVESNVDECVSIVRATYIKNEKSIFHSLMLKATEQAYKDYLASSIELDIFSELKDCADQAAIQVFSKNFRDLLLQSPLGGKTIIGFDPGFRTGCKLAVIGKSGEYLASTTIYPVEPHNKVEEAETVVTKLCADYNVEAIAIGNGTASRETDKFVSDLVKKHSLERIMFTVVNEAGASVYSASDVAREELPNLDITYRGSVSIARRLQDPLAELVKIDAKSIGVGQYQHDVSQTDLNKSLDNVVEDCVNYVGIDLNTASPNLLAYVSGIGKGLAKSIVEYRTSNGLFKTRKDLTSVPKLGDKAFEQAAGFLRIRNGENILDNTGVHPERYTLINNICSKQGIDLSSLIGNKEEIDKVFSNEDVVKEFGEYTVKYVVEELKKPGRDPRTVFKKTEFQDGLRSIEDVKEGMLVNGVISNITNFGVFVNIGVHEDGLIHISELTDRGFIKDPREVVSLGDEVRVRVIGVDVPKKQISLSIKQAKAPEPKPQRREAPKGMTREQAQAQEQKDYDRPRPRKPAPFNNSPRPKQEQQKKFEPRPPKVNPNSPFAALASIRDKVGKK